MFDPLVGGLSRVRLLRVRRHVEIATSTAFEPDHAVRFMIAEGEHGAASRSALRTDTLILNGHRGSDGATIIGWEPGSVLGTADGSKTSIKRSAPSA